jgi:hypothetical protein
MKVGAPVPYCLLSAGGGYETLAGIDGAKSSDTAVILIPCCYGPRVVRVPKSELF